MNVGEQATWALEVYKNGSLITEYTDTHTFTNTPPAAYIFAGKFVSKNTMICSNVTGTRYNVFLNSTDYTAFINNDYNFIRGMILFSSDTGGAWSYGNRIYNYGAAPKIFNVPGGIITNVFDYC
jgi:hypothetical protein